MATKKPTKTVSIKEEKKVEAVPAKTEKEADTTTAKVKKTVDTEPVKTEKKVDTKSVKTEKKPKAKAAKSTTKTKVAPIEDEKKAVASTDKTENETKVTAVEAETVANTTKAEKKTKTTTAKTVRKAKTSAAKTVTKAKSTTAKTEKKIEAEVATSKVKKETNVASDKTETDNKPNTVITETPAPIMEGPRRSVAFIGSECYPFVKTGGLGDVMYALPRALIKQNCDVKVILPRYECIPQKYQEKMVYKGAFDMELCQDGRSFYVGIMEYECDGVVYDFIDNQDFFSGPTPYYNLVDDIPKFCYFGKAALAALNYLNWIPDVIHCHDWQAGLVPIYLRTFFENTPVGRAKTMITIHNLRFQGIYNIKTLKYWTNLPDYVFNKDTLTQNWLDANMFKGGLAYSNMITTVSSTYAGEIQSVEYGEGLEEHLRYHSGKLRGIINGIDYDIWNPATDSSLAKPYDISNVLTNKKENKKALQEELGLEQDDHKFVIGLISRLTNQKGLDLVNAIISEIMDDHTQFVVLGTGSPEYENAFRYYENTNKGQIASCIQYDESRAHRIYAGADALLVPSQFEPCGLTQLTAMHYGTIPIVRETGGLKDTVEPYNMYTNWGNGFTFDRYEAGLLLDAINRAKSLYFTNRWCWDEMVQRDMDKDVSWDNAATQYRNLYLELTS